MARANEWVSRDDRERVELPGRATLANGRRVDVIVTNISRRGCEIHSDETLLIGSTVSVEAAKIERLSGQVRWSLFGRAGLRFGAGPQ